MKIGWNARQTLLLYACLRSRQSVSQSLNHERGLCKVSGDFIIAFYPTRHAYQIGDLRKTTISLLLRLVFFFFVLCA